MKPKDLKDYFTGTIISGAQLLDTEEMETKVEHLAMLLLTPEQIGSLWSLMSKLWRSSTTLIPDGGKSTANVSPARPRICMSRP